MKKRNRKKTLSLLFILSILVPFIGGIVSPTAGDIVSAKSDKVKKQEKFPFDDNILLSIFWPPTEDYITDEQYKLIADAGIDWVMGSGEESLSTPENQEKMLKLCAKYGIGMTVSDGNFGNALLTKTEEEIAAAVKQYEDFPAAQGFYLRDEPKNPNEYINAYIALKKSAPDKYMHLNFLPSSSYEDEVTYKAQMNDWCRLASDAGYPIEYLMFDRYPFSLNKGSMDRVGFFSNVRKCYEAGLENDVKTGLYIQAVCQEVLFRRPTDSEIRYEMYSALAFGFKQLSFFTWFTPSNRSEPFKDGIISADGKPNAHYETIKTINHEIHNIGSTLAKCDALEVYFSGYSTYGQPSVPDDFFVKTDEKDSVILSFLRHKETGRNYLMVVNNNFSKSQEVELTFNHNINSLWEVSKADGSLKEMNMDGQKLNIELAAGDGMFFALPEDFDHYKKESSQPEASTNLAIDSIITAPESKGSNGWYISYLQDGKRKSTASINGWKSTSTNPTYLKVDFKRPLKFNRIDLYPSGSAFDKGKTLPSEVSVSISNDGTNFINLKTISELKVDSLKGIQIDVPTTEAQYIRIDMQGSNGETYIALSEIEIYNDNGSVTPPEQFSITHNDEIIIYKKDSNIALNKQVSCSSSTPDNYEAWGWSPSFVNDGKNSSGWSSNVGANPTPDGTEYIIVDFGDLFAVNKITLVSLGYFPEDYFVELSEDGINWTIIKEKKGSLAHKAGQKINFNLSKPSTARFVRITATKLRGGGNDGYLFQLGEIQAYGTPVCNKTELINLINEYSAKGGEKNNADYQKAVSASKSNLVTQTQANSLSKALSFLLESLQDQSNDIPDVSDVSEDVSTSESPISSEEVSAPSGSINTNSNTILIVVVICILITGIVIFIIFKGKNK